MILFPFHKYPYSNFHELNLDWILNKIKEIEEQIKNIDIDVDIDISNDPTILEIKQNIQQLQTAIAQTNQNVQSLQTGVANLGQQIHSLTNRVSSLEVAVEELEANSQNGLSVQEIELQPLQ